MKPHNRVAKFLRDNSGASAVEYAIIILLISIASIGAFTVAGDPADASLTNTASQTSG